MTGAALGSDSPVACAAEAQDTAGAVPQTGAISEQQSQQLEALVQRLNQALGRDESTAD